MQRGIVRIETLILILFIYMYFDEFCGVKIVLGFAMSAERRAVTVRDLGEEAKKRIVFLVICVVGLSYLMSCKYCV